jgi:D-alanyl-D-alanine carboxypeptidase
MRAGSPTPPAARSWWSYSRLTPGVVWTTDRGSALVSTSRREFAPGIAFGYSNTDYLLLGEVVEGVTGNPWWEETRARILNPLAMTDSYVAGFEPATGTVALLARASSHRWTSRRGRRAS